MYRSQYNTNPVLSLTHVESVELEVRAEHSIQRAVSSMPVAAPNDSY
jgi:hypothetical protein